MATFAKSLRVTSRSIGVIVRSFALTFLLIELLYGIALAGLAYWMTSDGSVLLRFIGQTNWFQLFPVVVRTEIDYRSPARSGTNWKFTATSVS